MSLYRASHKDGIAWITGASTGIGRELVLQLAAKGWRIAATARSMDKLDELRDDARQAGGEVISYPGDVTDANAMAQIVKQIESNHGSVALGVFVAGNYWPVHGEILDQDNFRKTYDVNLFGVVNCVRPLGAAMRRHSRGHIGIVGSVSAYGGLPLASAYGGSKSAVNYFAQSLKFDYDKMNIRLQVFNPGFVDTPLTRQNKFAMPFLMTAPDAAERIVKGLDKGGFEVAFPRRFAWILKALNLLPYSLYFPLMNYAMGWKNRPLKPDT